MGKSHFDSVYLVPSQDRRSIDRDQRGINMCETAQMSPSHDLWGGYKWLSYYREREKETCIRNIFSCD